VRQRGLITQPQRNGDEPGDAELAERAAGGEVAAFEILYRRHAEAAWRVAQAVTGNTHDAADAVSDAFTRVFQALPQRLRDGGHFRPYLLASTRNAAIDVLRRNGRTSPTETDQIDRPAVGNEPAELVMDDADSTMVTRAFRSLPERWRSVLWLTEVEGIPPREAAALLGLSPNGVAQLAVRARTGLRERFLQAHLSGAEVLAECRFTVERLGAYVAGGLPPRDVAKVDQHLAGCPACTGRRAQLAEITPALLRRAALPLPAGLAALVAARWDLGAGTGAAAAGGAGAAGTAVAGAGVSAGGGVAAGGGAVAAGAGAGGAAGAGAAAALVPAAGGLAAAGAGTALVSAASLALLVAGVVGAGVVGNAPEPPAAVAPATPPAGAAARQAPTGPAPAPVPAPTAAAQAPAGGGLLAGLAPPAGPALPGPRVPVALGGVVGSPNQPVTQVVDVVTSVTGVPGNAVPVPGTSLLDVVASLAPGDQACPGVRILVLTAGCPPVVPPAPVGAAPPAELPRRDGPAAPLAPALPAPTPAPAPAITPPGGGLLSALTAPLAGASLLDGLLGDGLLGDGLLGDGLLGDGVPGTGFLRPVPPLPPAGG